MEAKFWTELFKLVVFATFVTGILEVMKGISAKGCRGMFKDLIKSLWHNTPICDDTLKTLNFIIALTCVSSFDYGVMRRIIDPGQNIYTPIATWVDYIGTASLVYTGADQLFKRFVKIAKDVKEAEREVTNGKD